MIGKPWTEKEITALHKLAGTMSSPAIGKELKRSGDSVKNKLKNLGLPSFAPKKMDKPAPLPVAPKVVKGSAWRGMAIVNAKPLRKKEVVASRGYVEYCTQCFAPVSNWSEHFERIGHRRPAA